MQRTLNLPFQANKTLVVCLFLLWLFLLLLLSFLTISLLVKMLFLVTASGLLANAFKSLHKADTKMLCHDGKNWFASDQEKTIELEIMPATLVNRYFVLLVFRNKGASNTQRWVFTPDTCTETNYRRLCQLLLV